MNFKILIIFILLNANYIHIFSQNKVLNGSFEDTTIIKDVSTGYYDTLANDWSMSVYGAGITRDSHSGNLAVYVWNWYQYAEGTLVNGKGNPFYDGGTPIDYVPEQLKGYYKYIYGSNDGQADSGVAEVLITSYNSDTKSRDTVAYGYKSLAPSDNYIPFIVNIFQVNDNIFPDTILIKFYSSISGFCNPEINCLYLYLDDISVTLPTDVNESITSSDLYRIYPNPTDGLLKITLPHFDEDYIIEISDILGYVLMRRRPNALKAGYEQFDINEFTPGTYFIILHLRGEPLIRKCVIKY